MKIERFCKKEIAAHQIETALELFFSGKDLFSVITLAGAGEEILGKYLEALGKETAFSQSKKALMTMYPSVEREQRDEKYVGQVLNRARNGMKHMDLKSGKSISEVESIDFDPHEDAVALLYRAIENYYALTGSLTPNMQEFLRSGTPH